MKKATEENLIAASDALEALLKEAPKLGMADLIDIGARNRAIAKNAEALDKLIKEAIKDSLKHKPGTKLGDLFKAVLKLVPVDRLDQKALKEEKPAIHSSYLRHDEDERVTFELR